MKRRTKKKDGRAPSLVPIEAPQVVLRPLGWAATRLNVSRSTVYNLARTGDLELVRMRGPGRRGPVRITERSIEKLLGQQLKQQA